MTIYDHFGALVVRDTHNAQDYRFLRKLASCPPALADILGQKKIRPAVAPIIAAAEGSDPLSPRWHWEGHSLPRWADEQQALAGLPPYEPEIEFSRDMSLLDYKTKIIRGQRQTAAFVAVFHALAINRTSGLNVLIALEMLGLLGSAMDADKAIKRSERWRELDGPPARRADPWSQSGDYAFVRHTL